MKNTQNNQNTATSAPPPQTGPPSAFSWLDFCQEDRRRQTTKDVATQAPAALQANSIPPEFPGIVYDVLKYFPEAMEALAKAVKEFYATRSNNNNPTWRR